MTCIHVAGCWKVDWIGWGEGAPEVTGAGHAQHSKEATIACGLQRFQGLLVPFRSWGSPDTVLAGQFQRCSFLFDAGALNFVLVSFWFQVVFPLQCSIFGSVAGRSRCGASSADCTSTKSHLFWFLTTGRFYSCTTKHKKSLLWQGDEKNEIQ
jgi:hypothetical protein